MPPSYPNRPIFTTPQDAEAAFYVALERSDLDAMMQVWSEDDEVICVHPGGPRLVGLAAVRESWRQLFASRTPIRVHVRHQLVSANMMLCVHNVLEYVSTEADEASQPPLIATNIYARGALGWQMIMHHASPYFDFDPLDHLDLPHLVH